MLFRQYWRMFLVFLVFIAWFSPGLLIAELSIKVKADINNVQQVSRGEKVYQRFCSLCHGKKLQGQAKWRIRKDDEKLPAPPHDETGHTWHHPDSMLFEITKFGLVPPNAPKNYKTDMPAWGDTLKDEDIWAVLAYIKSRWPKETQKIQAEINAEAEKFKAKNKN